MWVEKRGWKTADGKMGMTKCGWKNEDGKLRMEIANDNVWMIKS